MGQTYQIRVLYLKYAIFIIWIFSGVYMVENRTICRVTYIDGPDSDEFLGCEVEQSFINRKLLPKPPNCGRFSGVFTVPTLDVHLREYPWTAALIYKDANGTRSFQCTGVLINYRYVLTTAICATAPWADDIRLVSVRLGEYNGGTDPDCVGSVCNDPVKDIEVENVIVNERHKTEFDNIVYNSHNIALIRLKENVTFSESIKPICLPSMIRGYSETRAGRLVYSAGWIATGNASESFKKHKLVLTKISDETCLNLYIRNYPTGFWKDFHLCAARLVDRNTCLEFGGGPLMQQIREQWVIEGLGSHSHDCMNNDNYAGVYMKVSYFTTWIVNNLEP